MPSKSKQRHPYNPPVPEDLPLALEIGDLFSSFGSDHDQNLIRILKFAYVKVTGQLAVYHRIDFESQKVVNIQAKRSAKGFGTNKDLNGGACFESFITGEEPHLVINDLPNSPHWDSDPDLRRLDLKSFIGYPVHMSGSIIGVLALYDQEPGKYAEHHIGILSLLAEVIAYSESRRQVENDLSRNLQREKMLSDISTSAISNPDMNELLNHCLVIIGLSMAADGVTLLYQEKDSQAFVKTANWHRDTDANSSARNEFRDLLSLPMVCDAVEKGDPFYCNDLNPHSDHDSAVVLKRYAPGTLLMIPLDYQEKRYGCCCLHRKKDAMQWREEDIAAIKAAMQILAQRLTRQTMAHRLDESEALVNRLFQLAPAGIYSIDLINQRLLTVNDYLIQAVGYERDEFLALDPLKLLTPWSLEVYFGRMQDIAAGKPVSEILELEVIKKNGDVEWGRFHISHTYEGDRIVGANVVVFLITEQKKAREALANYQKNLETMVAARTSDLAKANQALRTEIEQRVQTAEELRASSGRLKEMNTAMRVLLDKRMEDHQHTEELIRLNLKELIDPYLTRLESSDLRRSQKQLVELIRVNLDEVVASSMPELSSKYYIFSPNELQVVNLIRKGKTSKEMAGLLNLSTRTVESYRDSIRKKLGLKNKKVNLRTYLASI